MKKTIKIIFFLLLFFSCPIFFPFCSAKYVIENVNKVANINIDCSKPQISLINVTFPDVTSNNSDNNNLITLHFKIIEKHISKNNLSQNDIKIYSNNKIITPKDQELAIAYNGTNELIYDFSFTHIASNDSLVVEFPEGIIIDDSSLVNDKTTFYINTNS